MSAAELSKNIGKVGLFGILGMKVAVEIVDSRYVFGRQDYLISPVGGFGSTWVVAGGVQVQ